MTPAAERYALEIRDWCLGRLERRRSLDRVEVSRAHEIYGRAMLWWVFEGKRYSWLEASLADSWMPIQQHVRTLLNTYNPVWRTVESPEGETDWIASAFTSLTSRRSRFVTHASRSGLGTAEKEALVGWLCWVGERWSEYTKAVGAPKGVSDSPPMTTREFGGWTSGQLRRYAHVAQRSRWPLLRNVVAASLRILFEPQEVDRLPLPTDHSTLFELVCMVRILRALEPDPVHVRWLDLEHGRNEVDLPGLSYHFQESLVTDEVLGTSVFDHGLREAMRRHSVRVPKFIDGLLAFDEPKGGFDGILVEAKSGSQAFDAAVYQLKCYRAALSERMGGRLLVWGIVERDDEASVQQEALMSLSGTTEGNRDADLWVFSSANQIGEVLRRVLGIGAA